MIKIVNLRKYDGPGEHVHRPYPLGNPFSHMQGTLAEFKVSSRYEAIMAYRRWLKERLKSDTPERRELVRLIKKYRETGELTLICFCVPKACHASYIKELIMAVIGG